MRDAKLLIIHADDLAVAHSQKAATFDALDRGAVTSASIMVPGPWLTRVANYAKAHPDADLGLHLTPPGEGNNSREPASILCKCALLRSCRFIAGWNPLTSLPPARAHRTFAGDDNARFEGAKGTCIAGNSV
jgi:YdjC-like protein